MIRHILFDIDGMINNRKDYFSTRYSKDFGVAYETMKPFFEGVFKDCKVGKADLKQEIIPYLEKWKWDKSAEEFIKYWFKSETSLDKRMLNHVSDLRSNGIKCYLQTRNEKYRTEYFWTELKLKDQFDDIFSSAYLGSMKPDIKFWAAVYKELHEPDKSEIFVWDDQQESVNSARQFGFRAELFTDFSAYEATMKELAE